MKQSSQIYLRLIPLVLLQILSSRRLNFATVGTLAAVCLIQHDGTWTFFFEVPSGQDRLEVWDGDFDFGGSVLNGSSSCVPDGVNTDTNDLNTGPIVPSFALATDSLPHPNKSSR